MRASLINGIVVMFRTTNGNESFLYSVLPDSHVLIISTGSLISFSRELQRNQEKFSWFFYSLVGITSLSSYIFWEVSGLLFSWQISIFSFILGPSIVTIKILLWAL